MPSICLVAARWIQDGQWMDLRFALRSVTSSTKLYPWRVREGFLTLGFSLGSDPAATLEVMDIAGRSVAIRELGGRPPGRSSTRLELPRDLAPGIYFARLMQGGAERIRRFALLD